MSENYKKILNYVNQESEDIDEKPVQKPEPSSTVEQPLQPEVVRQYQVDAPKESVPEQEIKEINVPAPTTPSSTEEVTLPLSKLGTLRKWAQRLNVSVDELREQALEFFASESADLDEESRWSRALSSVRNKYVKSDRPVLTKGTPRFFKGFITALSDVTDFYEIAERQAINFKAEHGQQEAINQGYYDNDNNLLDRQLERFGRQNPGYGKALQKSNVHRYLYGYASPIDEDNWKPFQLKIGGNPAKRFKVGITIKSLGVPCTFSATDRTKDEDRVYNLFANKDLYKSGFQPFSEEEIDPETIIRSVGNPLKLNQMETIAHKIENKKDYTSVFLIEVDIKSTPQKLASNGDRMFFVVDETLDFDQDSMLTLQHPDLPYSVSRGGRAFVWVRPWIGNRDGVSSVALRSLGAYPIYVVDEDVTATNHEEFDEITRWGGE